jgi:hypothetical protein
MSVMWLFVGGIVGFILGATLKKATISQLDHYCPHCGKRVYFVD